MKKDFIKHLIISCIIFITALLIALINDWTIELISSKVILIISLITFIERYILLKLFRFNRLEEWNEKRRKKQRYMGKSI